MLIVMWIIFCQQSTERDEEDSTRLCSAIKLAVIQPARWKEICHATLFTIREVAQKT